MSGDEKNMQDFVKKDIESGIEAAVRQCPPAEQADDHPVLPERDWDACIDRAIGQGPRKQTWRVAWLFMAHRVTPYVVSSVIGGVITGLVLLQTAAPTQKIVTYPGQAARSDSAIAQLAQLRAEQLPHIPKNKRTYVRAGERARYVIEPGTRARFHSRSDSAQVLLASGGTLVWQTDSADAGYHAIVTPHGILEAQGALVWMEINEFETQVQVLQGFVRVTAKKQRAAQQFARGSLVVIGAGDVSTTEMAPAFTGKRSTLYNRYIRWLDSAQKSVS